MSFQWHLIISEYLVQLFMLHFYSVAQSLPMYLKRQAVYQEGSPLSGLPPGDFCSLTSLYLALTVVYILLCLVSLSNSFGCYCVINNSE